MAKSFQETTAPTKGSAVIFDALNLAFRWKHKKATVFAEEYIATVRSFLNSYGNNKAIITADWYSSSYRRKLLPEYKANRKEAYSKQSEEEEEYFKLFIQEYERALELLKEEGFTVLRYMNVEADDLAAHVVKHREKYGFNQIWLISTDKDWDLLISDEVSRFSYTSRKEITLENWGTHYPNLAQEDFISFKCLVGDKGDNVPGVAGVGEKRATDLINQYGTAFDIYSSIPLAGTAKYIQNLNEFKDNILLNYELMDLLTYCDEASGRD